MVKSESGGYSLAGSTFFSVFHSFDLSGFPVLFCSFRKLLSVSTFFHFVEWVCIGGGGGLYCIRFLEGDCTGASW